MKLVPINVMPPTDIPVVCDVCETQILVELLVNGERNYRSVCGCRLQPMIPAQLFEQALTAVLAERFGPEAGFSLSSQVYGSLVQVRVAPIPGQVSCVWTVSSRNGGQHFGRHGTGP